MFLLEKQGDIRTLNDLPKYSYEHLAVIPLSKSAAISCPHYLLLQQEKMTGYAARLQGQFRQGFAASLLNCRFFGIEREEVFFSVSKTEALNLILLLLNMNTGKKYCRLWRKQ